MGVCLEVVEGEVAVELGRSEGAGEIDVSFDDAAEVIGEGKEGGELFEIEWERCDVEGDGRGVFEEIFG